MAHMNMANTTETSMKEVKIKTLNVFSGKRGELKKFLQTCKMYLRPTRRPIKESDTNSFLYGQRQCSQLERTNFGCA